MAVADNMGGMQQTPPEEAKIRYVVVPGDNAFNATARTSSFRLLSELGRMVTARGAHEFGLDTVGELAVLDRVDLNESTLVEMTAEQADLLQVNFPGLRVAPERIFALLRARMFNTTLGGLRPTGGGRVVTFKVVGPEGEPVVGAGLDIAIDPQRKLIMTDLVTDEAGQVEVSVQAKWRQFDLVIVTPRAGYWNTTRTIVALDAGPGPVEIVLDRIADDHRDALDLVMTKPGDGTGKGVTVAIIDAGVSLPASAPVMAGRNLVDGEPDDLVGDNGTGHGTHVAGIVHRIAPEAQLMSFRVCPQESVHAREIPIAKAIRYAVDAGCDIINLSLGQASEALAVVREVMRARALGVVVVAATGNEWGAAVSYPARSANVLAVTACGHIAGAPAGVVAADVSAPPPEMQGPLYFARFSNIGAETDFIAPGVAIVAPVSPYEVGVKDGTSMAAPAVAGFIARLLSSDARLLNSDRTQQRSDDIMRAAYGEAKRLGFGPDYEGKGILA